MERVFEKKRLFRGTQYVDLRTSRTTQSVVFRFGTEGTPATEASISYLQVDNVFSHLEQRLTKRYPASIGKAVIPAWALGPIVDTLRAQRLIVARDNLAEQGVIYKDKISRQLRAIAALENTVDDATEEVRVLQNRRDLDQDVIESLKGQLTEMALEKQKLDSVLSTLSGDLAASKSTLSSKEEQLVAQQAALTELGSTLDQERTNQEVQQDTVNAQETQLQDIVGQVGELQRRANLNDSVLEAKDNKIEELTIDIEKVRRDLRIAQEEGVALLGDLRHIVEIGQKHSS